QITFFRRRLPPELPGFRRKNVICRRILHLRQLDNDTGALTRPSLGPDAAAVPLDDAADDGQADTGALVAVPAVQALEGGEYLLGMARVEADAIVLDPQLPARGLAQADRRGGDPHLRRPLRRAELQGIGHQVLQQLPDLGRVGLQARQGTGLDLAAAAL